MTTTTALVDRFLPTVPNRATRAWYRTHLGQLVAIAGDRAAADLRPRDLAGAKITHHFARAVRRLFRWAVEEEELLPAFRWRTFTGPPCGARTRVLAPDELRDIRRAAARPFALLLYALQHTLARPGELRQLRWRDVDLGRRVIILTRFKARDRRRDGVTVRVIPLDRAMLRVLARVRRDRRPAPGDPVFTNRRGEAWTSNAARCAMARACRRAGIDQGGERVVCYTVRHTGATNATRNGVRDRLLADLLGHTTTRTTARYQHLAAEDLVGAIDRATAPVRPGGRRRLSDAS